MKNLQKFTCTGIKKNDFNGNIDGQNIKSDSTSFFLIQDLPSLNGKAKGQASQEYKFGTSEEFEKWAKLPFPLVVECEITFETTGKNVTRLTMTDIKLSEKQPSRAGASA